jgi:hypothetical protein
MSGFQVFTTTAATRGKPVCNVGLGGRVFRTVQDNYVVIPDGDLERGERKPCTPTPEQKAIADANPKLLPRKHVGAGGVKREVVELPALGKNAKGSVAKIYHRVRAEGYPHGSYYTKSRSGKDKPLHRWQVLEYMQALDPNITVATIQQQMGIPYFTLDEKKPTKKQTPGVYPALPSHAAVYGQIVTAQGQQTGVFVYVTAGGNVKRYNPALPVVNKEKKGKKAKSVASPAQSVASPSQRTVPTYTAPAAYAAAPAYTPATAVQRTTGSYTPLPAGASTFTVAPQSNVYQPTQPSYTAPSAYAAPSYGATTSYQPAASAAVSYTAPQPSRSRSRSTSPVTVSSPSQLRPTMPVSSGSRSRSSSPSRVAAMGQYSA